MGPAHDVAVAVDQRPAPAAVLGAPELAGSGGLTFPGNPVAGFDCREDALGIGPRNGDGDLPPDWLEDRSRSGESRWRRRRATRRVRCRVHRLSPPGMDLELPHSGEERPGIRRIHGEVGATGLLIHEQRPGPGDSAIERPIDAALRLITVGMAQRADEHDIGIAGWIRVRGMRPVLSRPISFQVAPASVDLYTPCPTEMAADFPSPVPAQTMFGSLAAIAREPIDCTGWSSKISTSTPPSLVL